jgi:hypothetical protein
MSMLRTMLVLLVMLLAPGRVGATEPMIVSPTQRAGELDAAISMRLDARLLDALRKSEVEPLELAPASAAALAACSDDACRAEQLAALGSRFLLVPQVEVEDQDYRMTLTLYGASGRQLMRVQDTCSLCGAAEAEDLLAELGARVGRKVELAAQTSTLVITSVPAGGRIEVGGAWVGTTPFELQIEPGSHEVRVELDGHIDQLRRIDAVAGERVSLAFTLQPTPAPPREVAGPRVALPRTLGAVALGLGLGTTLAGAVLIGIDERPITSDCSGDNVDAAGHCRWRHATLEPGIVLVSGGVALLGTGIALLVRARKLGKSTDARARVRVQPRAGGLSLSF